MRLLFLLPHVPALEAPNGGARSAARLIQGLAARHEVAVLCLRRRHDPLIDDVLRRSCAIMEDVDGNEAPGRQTWVQRANWKTALLLRTPRSVLRTRVPSYRTRLRALALDWRPDVVHVLYHVMGQYLSELKTCGARRVLTQYEPGITAAREAASAARGWRHLRARLETRVWLRYERRIMRQADAVVALTEQDRRALAPLAGPVPVVRIPLGGVVPARPLNAAGGAPPSVLFVGSPTHPPNVEAAVRLVRCIFPDVLRARPDARLVIVGPGAPEQLQALAEAADAVTLTGAVESVVPYLDAASVVVVPLRRGGGMRVKLMEALAAGKAVVASPLGAEGLEGLVDGQQLILARSDEEFASAIVALLNDAPERVRLGRRAREWACAHVGWDRSLAAYERLQEQLLSGPGVSTTGSHSIGLRPTFTP